VWEVPRLPGADPCVVEVCDGLGGLWLLLLLLLLLRGFCRGWRRGGGTAGLSRRHLLSIHSWVKHRSSCIHLEFLFILLLLV